MEPDNFKQEIQQVEQPSSLHQVTPLSKYLAMALFIILPFVGGYIGYTYAPEKMVEVEKIVTKEIVVGKEVAVSESPSSSDGSMVQCVVDADCLLVQPDCEDCQYLS